MRLKVDAKLLVAAAYLAIILMGLLLSGLVYTRARDAMEANRAVLQHQLPLLSEIASLKMDIAEQEKHLYRFYGTRDRVQFAKSYQRTDRRISMRIATIASIFPDAPQVPALERQFADLRTLAQQLDDTLKGAETARLPGIVGRISAQSALINGTLDELAGNVRETVYQTTDASEHTIVQMSQLVAFFSALLFFVALLVGYYARAYFREHAERQRLAMFPERNPHPVLRLGLDGEVMYANPATAEMAREIRIDPAQPLALLPEDLSDRLRQLRTSGEQFDESEYQVGSHIVECRIQHLPDLEIFHVYLSDVTDRKLAEAKLIHQAYHDPLTGLPNRRMFQEKLPEVLTTARREDIHAAILLMGLDRFKVVTGTLGHDIADQLLRAVASKFAQSIKASPIGQYGVLYRFEGDLFAVLLSGFTTSQAPVMLSEQILDEMGKPIYVAGREFFVTASIGISMYPVDGQDAVTLLKNADTAMHRVKEHGGNGLQCYTGDMNAMALEWLSLENYLRHAVDHDELRLFYQPQVDLRSGRIVGVEALVRWHHPKQGLLTPARFIALAEETGLIVPMGEWILRTACRQNKEWQDRGVAGLTVAVNLSARQFHEGDLPGLVADILSETQLDPSSLELEVTETVAMANINQSVLTMRELKRMGVLLALDDFGTGFSSLSYLKRFPVNKLKIDQSFIYHITSDASDAAIARAVITLGHNLNMKVIAEGVESVEQTARLRELGCDEIQGNLFGKPLSAAEMEVFLTRHRNVRAPL